MKTIVRKGSLDESSEAKDDSKEKSNHLADWVRDETVTVEEAPISFSPFISSVDCSLISHFSFNDCITLVFLDLAGDLEIQI